MEHAQSAFHPKICILSAAGGCGKTTLAVNLFRPFLENPLMLFMRPFPETMFSLRGMEAHFMRGSEVDDMVAQIVMYADRPVIADIRMNVGEEDRWHSGAMMMALSNPEEWQRVREDSQLVETNRDRITACQKAASSLEKGQKNCQIIVQSRQE